MSKLLPAPQSSGIMFPSSWNKQQLVAYGRQLGRVSAVILSYHSNPETSPAIH
jgi:hypothetical protein